MNFTPEQSAAFAQIKQWLNTPTAPQVFRLFGYAGTGKTTMAREMARGRPGVVFGAFTGKAASVMRAKGCHDASTIHAMIYRRVADDVTNRPIFVLNEEGPAARASLIIIDECSMVDRRLGEDLLSFGRRVLVLGDPAQLPPVKGAGFFTAASPDVLLTEIHRQAVGSPIIALADRVRRGGALKPSRDRGSRILDARQLDADTVLGADQILVGRNATRERINARVRELRGHRGTHPVAGDKLVCLRNNHQRGILNGEIWFVSEVLEPEVPDVVRLALRSDDGSAPSEITVLDLVVSVHRTLFDGVPYKPTAAQQRELDEFTYGYALTVHKAQGSQWNNVLLFDESDVFRPEDRRHLYTGLTRAAETITVVLL